MNLYELIDLLHDEALDIPMERERVVQHMSSRRERAEYVEMQAMLTDKWASYNDQDDSSWGLLTGLADLYISKTNFRLDADLDDAKVDAESDGDDE